MKLILPGFWRGKKFPGMNDFIAENRKNAFKGAKMKKLWQQLVEKCILEQNIPAAENPVIIHYTYFEQNKRRDLDNVAGFAHKVIQDALVNTGVLKNDGWAYVVGFTDTFRIDSGNPRIEIRLEEIENGGC